jgi:hypothetical protein
MKDKSKIIIEEVKEAFKIKEEIQLKLETEIKKISMIMKGKKKSFLIINKIDSKDQISIEISKMIMI